MSDAVLAWGAQALRDDLSSLLPGIAVEVVARLTSTNSALLGRTRGEPSAGEVPARVRRSVESSAFGRRAIDWQPCLLVAEHQTGGRGRLGRSWHASAGASLTFSLALALGMDDWSGLSLAVGVALADALDASPEVSRGNPRIGIKWPNDLWLVDAAAANGVGRKLGGVLVETISAGTRRRAVIGIGINVAALPEGQRSDSPSGYASLQELLPGVDPPQALALIARPLVESLQRFERNGFAAFAERFAARDILSGRRVATTLGEADSGIARGVACNGALIVETSLGQVAVASGEVSVRLHDAATIAAASPAPG